MAQIGMWFRIFSLAGCPNRLRVIFIREPVSPRSGRDRVAAGVEGANGGDGHEEVCGRIAFAGYSRGG
jgi:hypothetical protein